MVDPAFAIARPPTPPSTGCALLITLFSCPAGHGVVARLASPLGQLQRGDKLVLLQLAVAVGVGGLPNLVQVDGVQAAAAKHREDLLLAEPAAIARAADERKELTVHSHPRPAAPVASTSSGSHA